MYSSFKKEVLFIFGGSYLLKINSFSFPRFVPNVSISIEDANWKVSIFLHGKPWLI